MNMNGKKGMIKGKPRENRMKNGDGLDKRREE